MARREHWGRSEVQSLLFDREYFTTGQAKAWARKHGYRATKVHTTEHFHRLRQYAPEGEPCRTIEFKPGIEAVVCRSPRRHRR